MGSDDLLPILDISYFQRPNRLLTFLTVSILSIFGDYFIYIFRQSKI